MVVVVVVVVVVVGKTTMAPNSAIPRYDWQEVDIFNHSNVQPIITHMLILFYKLGKKFSS